MLLISRAGVNQHLCTGHDGECFSHCRPHSIIHNYSAILLYYKASHNQYADNVFKKLAIYNNKLLAAFSSSNITYQLDLESRCRPLCLV